MSSLSSRPKLTRESVEAIEDYRQLQSLAKQMDIPANQKMEVLKRLVKSQLEKPQVPPGAPTLNEDLLRTPDKGGSRTEEASDLPLPDDSSHSTKKQTLPPLFGYRVILEATVISIIVFLLYVLFTCASAEASTIECLSYERAELFERVRGSYSRLIDGVQKSDPRSLVLEHLHEVVKNMEGACRVDQIFNDITHAMTDEINTKGTSALLYCFSGREVCHQIVTKVVNLSTRDAKFGRCLVSMKAQGYDDEDLAGRTQLKLTKVLKDCTNAVVVFENLDRMSRGELVPFLNALSEGGSFMFDGKSVAANHAFYLLTMPGNPENKEVELEHMTFTARQEFYANIIGHDKQDNSSLSNVAAPFRRRIDFAIPVTGIKT